MTPKGKVARTATGEPITDELIERLAEEAEDGYDVDEILHRRRGRPPIGSGPSKVESVRLDPELREALWRRAARDRESVSSLIRKALRQYLGGGDDLAAEGSGWNGDLDELRSREELPEL